MNNSKKLGSRPLSSWFLAALAAALVAGCGQEDLTRATENPDDMVDPALVGFWEIPVPGGRWTLKIESYGHYEFSNVSGSPAPSHQGRFAARGGRWLLQSVSGIEDTGSYEVDDDAIELKGNLGALRWLRGAAITGVTPGVNVAPPQPATFGSTGSQAIAVEPPSQPALPSPATVSAAPQAASSAAIPDIVDPCLLVTADEAAYVFGTAATTKRTTPQPRTQNDCVYSGSAGQSFTVRSYNGRGLDSAGYLENRRRSGGVQVDGIGDGAVQSYREATGLASLDFVIGGTSVSLLIAGVDGDRAQPALVGLALQAAQRLTSSSSAYDVGGVDRFVGAWRVETYPPNGGKRLQDAVIVVASNGEIDYQTSASASGTLELAGETWRLESPLTNPRQGTYRLRGNTLTLDNEQMRTQLTRVECGKAPSTVQPPYTLARDLEGSMRPTTRLAPQLRPPQSKTLDPQLVGLWEGQGTVGGIRSKVLFSVDSRGWAVFAVYPYAKGRLEAANGQYTMTLEGIPPSRGSYSLEGGIRDGVIRMQEGENTLLWYPTDVSERPVYETPLVAQCG